VPELKSRLPLPALLALALGGCSTSLTDFSINNPLKGNDPLSSANYNYFYKRDQTRGGIVTAADLVGPDGRCAFDAAPAPALSPAAPAAMAPSPGSDPINPRSNQALYFTAGPDTGRSASAGPNALPPQVRSGPSGIALQMTECQVVAVAGYTDRVEISTDPRGQRMVTLTYLSGERPGIYRFVGGRLATMERVGEPAQPTRAAKAKKPPAR
jgi:hypothetical protein